MHGPVIWIASLAAFLALAGGATWLGITLGRHTAKKYPGLAMGLILFSSFFKLDPPLPPRAERIIKDEEDDEAGGAPPKARST
jgi:hypothetical protein